MQAMRSPDVCAEKAPCVSASRGCTSWVLTGAAGASGVGVALLEEKENIDIAHAQ
jgi:hypothetical protein